MWLGEVEEVVGMTGRPLAAMEGESLAHVLMRFQSGIVATLTALRTAEVHGAGAGISHHRHPG